MYTSMVITNTDLYQISSIHLLHSLIAMYHRSSVSHNDTNTTFITITTTTTTTTTTTLSLSLSLSLSPYFQNVRRH